VPQIAPEDYPSPLSIDDSEITSGCPLLSTTEQTGAKTRLRVIQTAFDPELEVNKKTGYRNANKRDHFYHTQSERALAEKVSTPTSLDELEVQVSHFCFSLQLSLMWCL